MTTDWRPVDGFDGTYEVSREGVIRSLPRHTGYQFVKGRELSGSVNWAGYRSVQLCRGQHKQRHAVHRIVCRAFHGMPEEEPGEVNHINGVKSDNRAENLIWVTRSQNHRHAADLGLRPHGELSHLAKLKLSQVKLIRAIYETGRVTQEALGSQFGVSQTCISKIIRKTKWRNN